MARASGSRAQRSMISVMEPGSAAVRSAAEPGREQLPGLGRWQDVEADEAGVLGGGQASQLAAAGHEDEAARRAGQQRADLLAHRGRCRAGSASAGGPAGCGTARPARPPRAEPVRGHAQGLQEPADRRTRAGGEPDGSKPRRFTYSCPSGNRWATRCAQCTARAVFPTPAVPPMAEITTVPGAWPPTWSSSSDSRASSADRPVKCCTAPGSCRGTATGDLAGPVGDAGACGVSRLACGAASAGSPCRIRSCRAAAAGRARYLVPPPGSAELAGRRPAPRPGGPARASACIS